MIIVSFRILVSIRPDLITTTGPRTKESRTFPRAPSTSKPKACRLRFPRDATFACGESSIEPSNVHIRGRSGVIRIGHRDNQLNTAILGENLGFGACFWYERFGRNRATSDIKAVETLSFNMPPISVSNCHHDFEAGHRRSAHPRCRVQRLSRPCSRRRDSQGPSGVVQGLDAMEVELVAFEWSFDTDCYWL